MATREQMDEAERAFDRAFRGASEPDGDAVVFAGGYEAIKRRVRRMLDRADETTRRNREAGNQ